MPEKVSEVRLYILRILLPLIRIIIEAMNDRPHDTCSLHSEERAKTIRRVTVTGMLVNLLLASGKLVAGIVGRSGAMVADAVHSVSDFATDIVVLVFVRLSAKPRDERYDYGHGKFETLATIIIGLALLGIGVGIIVNGARAIIRVTDGMTLPQPGLVALVAAAVSIVIKEWMYRYTVAAGRRAGSTSLIANAWHHRSDALSSIGTLIGICGARFLGPKWHILDPIAAIIVGALIIKVAYDLVMAGVGELMERSLPEDTEREIVEIIRRDGRIYDPHNLRTRRIGSNIAIEIHVRVPGGMTVAESHDATVGIERRLRQRYGEGTMVIVHVEPLKSREPLTTDERTQTTKI